MEGGSQKEAHGTSGFTQTPRIPSALVSRPSARPGLSVVVVLMSSCQGGPQLKLLPMSAFSFLHLACVFYCLSRFIRALCPFTYWQVVSLCWEAKLIPHLALCLEMLECLTWHSELLVPQAVALTFWLYFFEGLFFFFFQLRPGMLTTAASAASPQVCPLPHILCKRYTDTEFLVFFFFQQKMKTSGLLCDFCLFWN